MLCSFLQFGVVTKSLKDGVAHNLKVVLKEQMKVNVRNLLNSQLESLPEEK